jgi:hypothetical protein
MADENPKGEQQGLPITFLSPNEVPPDTKYANSFEINWTLTDATINFLQIIQVVVDNKLEGRFRSVGSIVLPWWQLKHLRNGLVDLIDRYEKANGELTRPKLP